MYIHCFKKKYYTNYLFIRRQKLDLYFPVITPVLFMYYCYHYNNWILKNGTISFFMLCFQPSHIVYSNKVEWYNYNGKVFFFSNLTMLNILLYSREKRPNSEYTVSLHIYKRKVKFLNIKCFGWTPYLRGIVNDTANKAIEQWQYKHVCDLPFFLAQQIVPQLNLELNIMPK